MSLFNTYYASEVYKSFEHAEKILQAMQKVGVGEKGHFGEEFIPSGGEALRSIRKWDFTFGVAPTLIQKAVRLLEGNDCTSQVNNINQIRDEIIRCVNENLDYLSKQPDSGLKKAIEDQMERLLQAATVSAQAGLKQLIQNYSGNGVDQTKIRNASKEFQDQIAQSISLFKIKAKTIIETKEKEAASIVLQAYIRRGREMRHGLPDYYYDSYAPLLNNRSKDMTRANGGKTKVYLPKEMAEVVFKKSGEASTKRFQQMREVRDIVERQGSTHLVIPRADFYRGYLVEDRLPINTDAYHNMALYLENSSLFDDAVRELTRLFSKVYLSDLVSSQKNPLSRIVGDFVRYDNLPLYIEKKVGKFGLIDLEHMENRSKGKGDWYNEELTTLVRIFPHHLDIIRDEAEKLKMKFSETSLLESAKKGEKYLSEGYTHHLQWLKEKGVNLTNATQLFEIKPERVATLTDIIERELLKLNQGVNDYFTRIGCSDEPKKNFLIGNPEEAAKEFAPLIYNQFIQNLKNKLTEQLNRKAILFEFDMVDARSPYMESPELYKSIEEFLENRITKENSWFDLTIDICEQLVHVIIDELVKGGEIWYCYAPKRSRPPYWIRW